MHGDRGRAVAAEGEQTAAVHRHHRLVVRAEGQCAAVAAADAQLLRLALVSFHLRRAGQAGSGLQGDLHGLTRLRRTRFRARDIPFRLHHHLDTVARILRSQTVLTAGGAVNRHPAASLMPRPDKGRDIRTGTVCRKGVLRLQRLTGFRRAADFQTAHRRSAVERQQRRLFLTVNVDLYLRITTHRCRSKCCRRFPVRIRFFNLVAQLAKLLRG